MRAMYVWRMNFRTSVWKNDEKATPNDFRVRYSFAKEASF